jgi:hypothetical protein
VPGSPVDVVNVALFFKVQFTQMMGSFCCGVPYFWCTWSTLQCIE